MSDTPVLKIPLDLSDLDVFEQKIGDLKKQMASASAGSKLGQVGQGAQGGVAQLTVSLDKLSKVATNPKIIGNAGFFSRADRQSKEIAKAWQDVAKAIERSSKSFNVGLGRELTKLGGGGIGILGLIRGLLPLGALAGILGTAWAANTDIARQTKTARSLGIPIGVARAFGADFDQLGLGESDLSNVENARYDITKANSFNNAGINQQERLNAPVDQLTFDTFRNIVERYKQQAAINPQSAANWFENRGFADLGFSLDQIRTAANAPEGQLDKQWEKYQIERPKLMVADATGQKALDLQQKIRDDLNNVEQHFHDVIAQNSEWLGTLADAASKAAIAVTDFGVKVLHIAADAVGGLTEQGDNPIGPTGPIPAFDSSTVNGPRIVAGFDRMGQWMRSQYSALTSANSPFAIPDSTKLIADPNREAHRTAIESAQGLKPKTLETVEYLESKGGRYNVGPKLKNGEQAIGPYQFLGGTAKTYGLNPADRMDEAKEAEAAGRYLKALSARYKGDYAKVLAAYNWGEGNVDRDINGYTDNAGVKHAGHGDDWLKFAPKETQKYVDEGMDRLQPGIIDRLDKGLAEVGQRIRELVRDGGGASLRHDNPQQYPFKADIRVHGRVELPSGGDVFVSGQSLAY